eukprot:4785551-Prymnesium_polylepis.1
MRSIVSASCSAATHCSQAAWLTCVCIARTAAVSSAACAPPLPLRTQHLARHAALVTLRERPCSRLGCARRRRAKWRRGSARPATGRRRGFESVRYLCRPACGDRRGDELPRRD